MKPLQLALRVTTVVNLAGGTLFAVLAHLGRFPLLVEPVAMDDQTRWHYALLWWFVVSLGFGYALASRDPTRQTALVLAGGLGKAAAAGMWAYLVLTGVGSPLLVPVIAFDGVLGIWFLAFVARELRAGRG